MLSSKNLCRGQQVVEKRIKLRGKWNWKKYKISETKTNCHKNQFLRISSNSSNKCTIIKRDTHHCRRIRFHNLYAKC
ncbi:hypothetical protein SNEBB_003346 [Seison nebaliae]|nr:hypothetical protein SNEBB_003346 [Seison nebaliae]